MSKMVEVTIDSIRISLMSQHRVVLLKDTHNERYLSIWIGPCEADAITWELQEHTPQRPLTHDLLKSMVSTLGGTVTSIAITELKEDIYFAKIIVEANGHRLEVDSRPSDAIALAVRVKVPIYVDDGVMERAASTPDQEIQEDAQGNETPDERLSVFKDFVDTLDLDDLEDSNNE